MPRLPGRAGRVQLAKAHGTKAADFMSTPVANVAPGASLRTAARLLHRRWVRHLPVVDQVLWVSLGWRGHVPARHGGALLRGTVGVPLLILLAGVVLLTATLVLLRVRLPWPRAATPTPSKERPAERSNR